MAVVVLRDQPDHPAVQVAEVISQVGIVHVDESLPAEFTVSGKRALAQEIIAERLGTKLCDDIHRLNNVAEALANLLQLTGFLALEIDEAVGKDLSWRLLAGCHQHGRPEGAVEARNVLADKVQVGRPPLSKALPV